MEAGGGGEGEMSMTWDETVKDAEGWSRNGEDNPFTAMNLVGDDSAESSIEVFIFCWRSRLYLGVKRIASLERLESRVDRKDYNRFTAGIT
jgi:hypothetical protein